MTSRPPRRPQSQPRPPSQPRAQPEARPQAQPRPRHQDRPAERPAAPPARAAHAPQRNSGPPVPRRADLLYGRHAVLAAWRNPRRKVDALWITREAAEEAEGALRDAARQGLKRPAPMVVDKDDIARMLPEGAVHQGLAMASPSPHAPDLADIVVAMKRQPGGILVMLDQVTDPMNVGAILRSAAAFGAAALLVHEHAAPIVTGTLARAACGGLEHVPMLRLGNLSRGLKQLQNAGVWCVGLSEHATSDLAESLSARHLCLVLGSEGKGLRRLVAEHCDTLARLPTSPLLPSLNVSNAAAIALYEAAKAVAR